MDTYSPWTYKHHLGNHLGMSKIPYLVALGATIRDKRKKSGKSQEGLAFDAGLDRTYLGGVERGERNLTILNLLKIAHSLSLTPSVLLTEAEEFYSQGELR
jgi:transcriptional regulator with XRE-family HTH domain